MNNIEELNNIDILTVAKNLGLSLTKSNMAKCCLHKETKPSLKFYIETNSWYCFGCKNGGSVIDLVKAYNKCDFKTACSLLNTKFYNSFNNHHSNQYKFSKKNNACINNNFVDFEINKWILDRLTLDTFGKNYLIEHRKISLETLEKYNIRTLNSPKQLFYSAEKIFGKNRLLNAGFYKMNPKKEIKPVWWTSGVVIPFFNFQNKIQTLQIRYYNTTYGKYSFLSKISLCIYNEKILHKLNTNETIFICEGAFDALCLLDKGLNAVAIPGANNMKLEWYSLFRGFNNIIIFDNDSTGKKQASLIKSKMDSYGINANLKKINNYKDINDMICGI